MFWIVYYSLGFFLASGAVTAMLIYSDVAKSRLGWKNDGNIAWAWYAIAVGGFVTLLWFPTLMFLLFASFWMVTLRYARKYVHIDTPKD